MVVTSSSSTAFKGAQPGFASRQLRPRGDGATQSITTVELFFDLVYVFAVTQLSHLILNDLSITGVAHAVSRLGAGWRPTAARVGRRTGPGPHGAGRRLLAAPSRPERDD